MSLKLNSIPQVNIVNHTGIFGIKRTIMKDVTFIVKDKEGNLLNHRCYLHISDNTIEVRLMEK